MPEQFHILSPIRNTEIIAVGRGVRSRRRLNREFGTGRWRKMKGSAIIRLYNGRQCEAEIHWYEAHGVGRVLFKRKKTLRWL
ncbi:MAG: hypothetical protein ABSC42_15950 [Tepidisphaeraceae bacterium]|jgi:hypothetical protein